MLLSIDRLVFRFSFHADGLDSSLIETNHHLAFQDGLIGDRSTPNRVRLNVPLTSMKGPGPTVALELFLPTRDMVAGTVYGFIAVNPLRYLRDLLGDEVAGAYGIDNKPNVIGPTDANPDIERTCVDFVRESVERALGAVLRLLGTAPIVSGGELWLSGFEATRDLSMAQAPAMAWRVAHGVLSGSRFTSRDLYAGRRGLGLQRGFASCRFYERATGAAVKLYAKRDDLLREEWALEDRGAVCRDADATRADLSAAGAVALVEQTLDVARTALAVAEAEVLAICQGSATPADVALALLPLLSLGDPKGPVPRGRPAAVAADKLARRAYDAILLTGQCTVTGEEARGRLRRCLDQLVATGVLARRGTSLCYSLAPRLVSGISGCLIQDREDPPAGQAG